MKKTLIKIFVMTFRGLIYGTALQVFFMGMLAAKSSEAQSILSVREATISVNLKDASLSQCFQAIESSTNFRFSYDHHLIDSQIKISFKAKQKSVSNLLLKISKEADLKFKQVNNNINVQKMDEEKDTQAVIEVVIQGISITGKVTSSEDNEGLPGVNVVVKGTSQGTVTDVEGNYSLEVPEGGTLVFSSVGYVQEEVLVGTQTVIDLSMKPDITALDEIVVLGYGTQSKTKITGAVGTVATEDVEKVSYANTGMVLQGRVPGVRVETNGGAPGADTNIVIRGTGTFGNDQPLYVVDGNIVNSISYLNTNDIEDISVLKDAAAAAIYGSRAANGVVLVTTKKGKSGDLVINFEARLGTQSPTNTLDFLNAREYADYHNQARDNDGDARAVPNDTGFDPSIDTDWQGLSINNAPYQDYSFNASGGGQQGTFYISAQYLDQKGIVVDSGFKRYNLTANTRMGKGKFSMDQNLTITRAQSNFNTFYGRERGEIPTIKVYDENNLGGFAGIDPNYYGVARGINWYGRAIQNDDKSTVDRIVASLAPKFEIIEGLTYKLNLGLSYSIDNYMNFEPKFFQSTSQEASNDIARLDERMTRNLGTLIENTLNYRTSIGKNHNLDVLVGYTYQSNEARRVGGIGTDFNFNEFRVLDAANEDTDVYGYLSEYALVSYLGRLNYDFKSKYLFSATIRRDGSSRFIKDNRWGNFPSFSAGWILSNESFFNSGFISFLKLRASYGELGSQNIGNYQTTSVLNINNYYNLGGQVYSGAIVRSLANSTLIWETSKTTNIALDAKFFEGKLAFTAEYFNKTSEDILADVPIPTSGGLGSTLTTNAASIENKGFEFMGSYASSYKPDGFNYNVSLNFTTVNNEVLALGAGVNPISGGSFTQQGFTATRTDVGRAVASFYGYVTEGVYQTQEEIEADGRTGVAVLGDMNFVDLDNDGVIDDDDRDYLGSSIPDFEFGLNFGANYKNFDLTVFVQGVQGNDVWNAKRFQYILDGAGGNKIRDVQRAWTPTNTNTDIPRVTIRDLNGNKRSSDFFLEDGSYVRFKVIQLGYTIPKSLTDRISISKARVYFSGQDLFTFTNYTGYDPEVGRSLGGSLFNGGVDRRAYPRAKTVLFGLQVSF